MTRSRIAAVALAAALSAGACGEDGGSGGAPPGSPAEDPALAEPIIFSGQGNDLVAYAAARGGGSQVVITNAAEDPDGTDINGQVCFVDETTFIAGEDTGQPDPPAGWGIFTLAGSEVGDLTAEQVGKMTPTYQPAESDPEPYGCTVLDDGRVVTTDVGNQAAGPGTGQLIVWFPPIEGTDVAHCKVDTAIATAQQVVADGDDALVASARPPTVGVWRYTDLPTGPSAVGGCRSEGGAAEPEPAKDLFIEPGQGGLSITNGIAPAPDDGWYVSSVISGVINEYDADGAFVRTVLAPPPGEGLGAEPFSTGTPLGLATGPDGTLFYADIGIVFDGDFGPGDRTGTIRAIPFYSAEPGAPVIIDDGLPFPDAVTVHALPAG